MNFEHCLLICFSDWWLMTHGPSTSCIYIKIQSPQRSFLINDPLCRGALVWMDSVYTGLMMWNHSIIFIAMFKQLIEKALNWPIIVNVQDVFASHKINGLVQDCSNSIANAMELLQSCTKPLIMSPKFCFFPHTGFLATPWHKMTYV